MTNPKDIAACEFLHSGLPRLEKFLRSPLTSSWMFLRGGHPLANEAQKNATVNALRLYFKGIVYRDLGPGEDADAVWQRQWAALRFMTALGTDMAGSFYCNRPIDLRNAVEGLEAHIPCITECIAPAGRIMERDLTEKVAGSIPALMALNESHGPFDTVVPVATGGFDAALLANHLLAPENFVPAMYSGRERLRGTQRPVAPAAAPKGLFESQISGRVLVMEDEVFMGRSILAVMKHVSRQQGVSEVYGFAPSICMPGEEKALLGPLSLNGPDGCLLCMLRK